jgi:hypothetical protein
MPAMRAWMLEALVPGSIALAEGRTAAAIALLPATLVVAGLLLAAGAISPEHAAPLRWTLLAVWAVLAAVALLLRRRALRRAHPDPAAVRAAHADLARALISGPASAAPAAGRRLVQLAPASPGAWQLLALAEAAAGDATAADAARRRATRLVATPP